MKRPRFANDEEFSPSSSSEDESSPISSAENDGFTSEDEISEGEQVIGLDATDDDLYAVLGIVNRRSPKEATRLESLVQRYISGLEVLLEPIKDRSLAEKFLAVADLLKPRPLVSTGPPSEFAKLLARKLDELLSEDDGQIGQCPRAILSAYKSIDWAMVIEQYVPEQAKQFLLNIRPDTPPNWSSVPWVDTIEWGVYGCLLRPLFSDPTAHVLPDAKAHNHSYVGSATNMVAGLSGRKKQHQKPTVVKTDKKCKRGQQWSVFMLVPLLDVADSSFLVHLRLLCLLAETLFAEILGSHYMKEQQTYWWGCCSHHAINEFICVPRKYRGTEWSGFSPEKKKEIISMRRVRRQSRTEAQKEVARAKKRSKWARLTETEKEDARAARREQAAAMTNEEKDAFNAALREKWALLPEAEKEKKRTSDRQKYAEMPKHKKENRRKQKREHEVAKYAAMPKEGKDHVRDKAKDRYHALPPDKKAQRFEKQKETKAKRKAEVDALPEHLRNIMVEWEKRKSRERVRKYREIKRAKRANAK
ncbi:hypothetical protein GQ53DRAFT_869763 [Thozetella sp. PMI_491]|nr:hypothetical protein GQ53DRAFT_869763 [Thozetella sp. PMI_491]